MAPFAALVVACLLPEADDLAAIFLPPGLSELPAAVRGFRARLPFVGGVTEPTRLGLRPGAGDRKEELVAMEMSDVVSVSIFSFLRASIRTYISLQKL